MNRKYDWPKIKLEYVQGDDSVTLRGIAEKHGIGAHSIIMGQSKRGRWGEAREEYRGKVQSKAITVLAGTEVTRLTRQAAVLDNAVEAIDEAISKMRSDMKATVKRERAGVWVDEPLLVIRPQDVALLIDRLNVLFNRPSQITEERNLGVSVSAETDIDSLRAIVEATRGVPLDARGGASSSPLPRIDGPRSN